MSALDRSMLGTAGALRFDFALRPEMPPAPAPSGGRDAEDAWLT